MSLAVLQQHPRPIYEVSVDGKDITATLQGRLVSLTLTDNRGLEADQLDIVLDDSDGRLNLPPRGAQIRLALGWADEGLVDKGSYTVDEVEHAGSPDQLTIRARSADLRAGLATQKERSFHRQTLGEIVRTLAGETGLSASIPEHLAAQVIEHVDQTNESSANLLTRLAGMFDAVATVKDGKLLFIAAGGAVSAGGSQLPSVRITRQDGDSHRFSVADREAYTAVRASWNDIDLGTKGEVIWGKEEDAAERDGKPKVALDPSAENIKTLRHVYANQANAKRAARAEWRRLQRGMATFTITLARGRPELFPEIPATVSGWKPAIDNTDWLISRVTHNLTDSGYTTTLELEIRATEIAKVS